MHEGIEPGAGGDGMGHRGCRSRIEDDDVGQQFVSPRPRLATGPVGDDARASDLGARARRGGNGDDRPASGQRCGAQQVRLDATVAGADHGGLFGDVERRTATDADHDRITGRRGPPWPRRRPIPALARPTGRCAASPRGAAALATTLAM